MPEPKVSFGKPDGNKKFDEYTVDGITIYVNPFIETKNDTLTIKLNKFLGIKNMVVSGVKMYH